jgi:C4-dicarboxylate transporter DctM subunit
MSSEIVGLIGVLVLVLFLFSGMWIGLAMLFVGFWGLVYLEGFGRALGVLGTLPYSSVASYSLSVVPLFIFMGVMVSNTGLSGALYNAAYKSMGQLRGGLAMATVFACCAFGAICGSSTATAVTMGKVALPEMKRYKYDDRLATGSVAAGGTMGILIPPSIGFILYGIITQESIGKLFMAGIIPGILQALFYAVTIWIICRINPKMGPEGEKTSIREKFVSLKAIWPVLALFMLVMGGMYTGIFTPTEGGAVGAFGAIVISFVTRRLTVGNFVQSMLETGQTAAIIILLIVGAFVFSHFMAVSRFPMMLSEFTVGLHVSKYAVLTLIIFMYIILGMFLDIMSAIILTTPIFFPVILALGFDPIWYGVIMVRMMEIGLITPPVGMNVYVLGGVTDVPMKTIFRGVVPFVVADMFHLALLVAVPILSLLLPKAM